MSDFHVEQQRGSLEVRQSGNNVRQRRLLTSLISLTTALALFDCATYLFAGDPRFYEVQLPADPNTEAVPDAGPYGRLEYVSEGPLGESCWSPNGRVEVDQIKGTPTTRLQKGSPYTRKDLEVKAAKATRLTPTIWREFVFDVSPHEKEPGAVAVRFSPSALHMKSVVKEGIAGNGGVVGKIGGTRQLVFVLAAFPEKTATVDVYMRFKNLTWREGRSYTPKNAAETGWSFKESGGSLECIVPYVDTATDSRLWVENRDGSREFARPLEVARAQPPYRAGFNVRFRFEGVTLKTVRRIGLEQRLVTPSVNENVSLLPGVMTNVVRDFGTFEHDFGISETVGLVAVQEQDTDPRAALPAEIPLFVIGRFAQAPFARRIKLKGTTMSDALRMAGVNIQDLRKGKTEASYLIYDTEGATGQPLLTLFGEEFGRSLRLKEKSGALGGILSRKLADEFSRHGMDYPRLVIWTGKPRDNIPGFVQAVANSIDLRVSGREQSFEDGYFVTTGADLGSRDDNPRERHQVGAHDRLITAVIQCVTEYIESLPGFRPLEVSATKPMPQGNTSDEGDFFTGPFRSGTILLGTDDKSAVLLTLPDRVGMKCKQMSQLVRFQLIKKGPDDGWVVKSHSTVMTNAVLTELCRYFSPPAR